METLKFEFSVEEANLVLRALAKQPFEIVTAIIDKIHAQAKEQQEKAIAAQVEEVKPE
jgi:LPS sulfotransferase NodH